MKVTFFVLFTAFSQISALAEAERYKWRYNTIAHTLLRKEENTLGLPDAKNAEYFDEKYGLLDKIIFQSVNYIGKVKATSANYLSNISEAKRILRVIDSTLYMGDFIVCTEVNRFSTALSQLDSDSAKCKYNSRGPLYRSRKDPGYNSSKHYNIDCDLGSMIYLGIADVIKLPIRLVQIRNHFFIRWVLPENKFVEHLNWDINNAEIVSDEEYARRKLPGEEIFNYYRNMDSTEIVGYYEFVIGYCLNLEKRFGLSKKYYLSSIEKRPYHPAYKGLLAKMLILSGQFETKEDYQLANDMGRVAVSLHPKSNWEYLSDHRDYVEALACSYALLGDFNMALQTIKLCTSRDEDLMHAFERKETGVKIYRRKRGFDI